MISSRLEEDLGVLLELLAVTSSDVFLLFEVLEGEFVFFSELFMLRPIENIKNLLGFSLALLLKSFGSIFFGDEKSALDLGLE